MKPVDLLEATEKVGGQCAPNRAGSAAVQLIMSRNANMRLQGSVWGHNGKAMYHASRFHQHMRGGFAGAGTGC